MNKKRINKTASRKIENLETEEMSEREQMIVNLMHQRFSTIRKTLGDKAAQFYIDAVESEMQKHYKSRLVAGDTDLVSDLVQ